MNAKFESELEPARFKQWYYWLRKKRLQVIVRTHLALYLAVGLAILVVCREFSDLEKTVLMLNRLQWLLFALLIAVPIVLVRYQWMRIIRHVGFREHLFAVVAVVAVIFFGFREGPNLVIKVVAAEKDNPWSLPILIITIATCGAALWEMVGDKLSESTRDVHFAFHVHQLLRLLDAFYKADPGKPTPAAAQLLEEFTKEVIRAACDALCGRAAVCGAYMTPREENSLKLWQVSANAHYDLGLTIPLPQDKPGPGPGAWAFKQEHPYNPVYLPEKERTEAWSVQARVGGAHYNLPPPTEVDWVEAKDSTLEAFQSVLCVPVRFYGTDGKPRNNGVLTFSTKRRDPFLPNDFRMAECFARVLAQAMAIATKMDEYKDIADRKPTLS